MPQKHPLAKAEPKPPPEPDRILSDVEEVYAVRYIRLLAVGIHPDEAISLIDIPDVAHQAERLYAKGCPPDLIVEILT
jgi:hypothetical protein